MKKYAILCISIFTLLLLQCKTKIDDGKTDITSSGILSQDSGRLILSIPDWALDVSITTIENCNLDSLKALNAFDKELFRALLTNVNQFGKYTLTKKYNPCCPCTAGGRSCCACLSTMSFASPSAMQAKLKIEGSETNLEPDPAFTEVGVDIFTIPAGIQVNTLIIDGKGIGVPLRFNFE